MDGLTFDDAQDAFRATPCLETAQVYAKQAQITYNDEMISDATFAAAQSELDGFVTLVPMPA